MKTAQVINIGQPKAPQVEDGYTRIANELFDAILGADLTGRELLVALAVIRKTYGYNKKQDDISASQLGEICGLARTHVTSTLKKLEAKNIIQKRAGNYGCVVGIQKDYSRWIISTKEISHPINIPSTELVLVPNEYKSSTDSVQVDSAESVHTKDNLPKDNQKTKRSRGISLRTYLENCKKQNIKPIPEDHAVFEYARTTGIPDEFLRLQWLEFRNRYQLPGAKRYTAWAQMFELSVRGVWFKLWYINADGNCELTTVGKQAAKLHGRES